MSCERPEVITKFTRWREEYGTRTREDMDLTEGCFGIVRVKSREGPDFVELYSEDDESYTIVTCFSIEWKSSLARLLSKVLWGKG